MHDAMEGTPEERRRKALDYLAQFAPQVKSISHLKKLADAIQAMVSSGLPNLSEVLPLLLQLKGRPYTLIDHFPFEPFYNVYLPRRTVYRTGRQVAKSTNLAAQGIVSTASIPYFNTLYITPLYEMVRRFSGNYVRAFIEDSPFNKLWTNSKTASNVLQRTFTNRSTMHFSYAFLSPDRVRGINADRVTVDEAQDLDPTFLPVILETLSGSRWALQQYAGTSKTRDGNLELLWDDSSQAEWEIVCHHCGYENYACLDYHLEQMTGPLHADVGEITDAKTGKSTGKVPGLICASPRCRRWINSRLGRWRHRFPDRIPEFAGYHIPQQILPLHNESYDKWRQLIGKSQGKFGATDASYTNEVCGEPYDKSVKLVSQSDLELAGCLHPNTLAEAVAAAGKYECRVLAIDWGGGGGEGPQVGEQKKKNKGTVSWTVYAVLGWDNSGRIDVIYGYRSHTPNDHDREALIACELLEKFKIDFLVHDYAGAGALREKMIMDHGWPYDRTIPMSYVPASVQKLIRLVPATEYHTRNRYQLDKPRSLVLTCSQIRHGGIRFFKYDFEDKDNPGLLHDFLALVEDKSTSDLGRDIYKIIRAQNKTDDFAHAVNMGCCGLWHRYRAWPKSDVTEKYRLSEEFLAYLSPHNPNWEEY